jgi:cytochrome c oxidase subunit 2
LVAAAVLAVLGLGLGACGGDDDKSSAGGETKDDTSRVTMPSAADGVGSDIEVTAKEFSFNPAKLTVKAGVPARIVLKNIGSIEHDLTVDDAAFKLTVGIGGSKEKDLKADKPGTYEFHCSIAGHKDAGMKGELTVE